MRRVSGGHQAPVQNSSLTPVASLLLHTLSYQWSGTRREASEDGEGGLGRRNLERYAVVRMRAPSLVDLGAAPIELHGSKVRDVLNAGLLHPAVVPFGLFFFSRLLIFSTKIFSSRGPHETKADFFILPSLHAHLRKSLHISRSRARPAQTRLGPSVMCQPSPSISYPLDICFSQK